MSSISFHLLLRFKAKWGVKNKLGSVVGFGHEILNLRDLISSEFKVQLDCQFQSLKEN